MDNLDNQKLDDLIRLMSGIMFQLASIIDFLKVKKVENGKDPSQYPRMVIQTQEGLQPYDQNDSEVLCGASEGPSAENEENPTQ